MRRFAWEGVLLIALALAARTVFPRTVVLPGAPRIITQYDTTRVIDTLWRERLRVRWDTAYLERVTVTPPETVRVLPRLVGLTFLHVPPARGDSMIAEGFSVTPADSGHELARWRIQWWMPGSLQAVDATRVPPRVSFYPSAKVAKSCGLGCTAKHYALGGLIGFSACQVIR